VRASDFDFDLPPGLIAQSPLPRRDASRMMVVDRREGRFHHRMFRDFPGFINRGDLLVLNDARVIPAKAWGRRGAATIEFLFVKELRPGTWHVLCRPAKRVRTGDRIEFAPDLKARVEEESADGRRTLAFDVPDVLGRLKEIGFAPLPPYIKRKKSDWGGREADLDRYQTVFAAKDGAIAAPTAGLHFTPEMLEALRRRGAGIVRVTLDVGLATFQPMRAENVEEHRMLEESYEVPTEAAAAIDEARTKGINVLAVGTTVVRTLESAGRSGRLQAGPGTTSLFIRPGYEFRVVDRLLTNFHLPRSTLLMLVSALAGRELLLEAYREAVRETYRFFSFGDCMLII
jgi:S-adenosylmethionine:tRNA ribosyltransferase-isomerase